ncbi:MAG: hypothetical protein V7704_02185 [Aurantimonas endophytica]|uniref:Uncharacterized protein n=1 Tax=Aurantimonas endophytica TaxID=1522175 RepID=A0A7W6MPQ2_9HYPH|nr:hypothetical protein [Aurantimonas endophytica]MBB4003255.1 hypothetical protein [Aurantimonas endophytica]MCO6404117.1 hypothetical protein [Aurantimonas endophytica]
MQFSDLSLVLQIVTALISSWISLLVIWALAIEIFSAPRRAGRLARGLRAFATLAPAWLLAQGYVVAIAKWFATQNSVSWVGLGELLWALAPGLNLIYAYDWALELLAFKAAFVAALFGFWRA